MLIARKEGEQEPMSRKIPKTLSGIETGTST